MDPEEKVLTPEEGTDTPQEEEQPQEQPSEPAPSEPVVEPPVLAPEETVDYWKEKATEQGKENIVLNAKVKEYEARRDLTKEPAESELQAAIPDWDLLEPWQKQVAKDAFLARRTSEVLLQEDQERKAQAKWNSDLEFVIAKNPSLQGKEQAFKEFASKPSRRGVEPDILIGAFLHQATTTPKPKSTSKQPGLEPGNGGPKTPDKPKFLSPEELQNLRKTDEKGYRAYIATHDLSQLEI